MQGLWGKFQNFEYVWMKAGERELSSAARCNSYGKGAFENFIERLLKMRLKFDIDAEFEKLHDKNIIAVSRQHSEYPKPLLHLPDAPHLLYRKGAHLEIFEPGQKPGQNTQGVRRGIAVVGTRNPTKYGETVAYDLATALSRHNAVVVSGLAFGIDAVSHFAAVSEKKPTVAVLACGLYEVAPASHHRLAEEILQNGGALISEYPPSSPAYPGRFLERNRIIAGLSEATVIIEAGRRSGALATARLALEYNRDVYALPGDITKAQAQGCLKLLYEGAAPLVSIQQFLQDRELISPAVKIKPLASLQFSPEELLLTKALQSAPCSPDTLIEKTGLPAQTINILLTQLEFQEIIRRTHDFLWELTIPL